MPIIVLYARSCPDAPYADTSVLSPAAIPSLSSIHIGTAVTNAPESIIPKA